MASVLKPDVFIRVGMNFGSRISSVRYEASESVLCRFVGSQQRDAQVTQEGPSAAAAWSPPPDAEPTERESVRLWCHRSHGDGGTHARARGDDAAGPARLQLAARVQVLQQAICISVNPHEGMHGVFVE